MIRKFFNYYKELITLKWVIKWVIIWDIYEIFYIIYNLHNSNDSIVTIFVHSLGYFLFLVVPLVSFIEMLVLMFISMHFWEGPHGPYNGRH